MTNENNALAAAIKYVTQMGGIDAARKELDELDKLKGLR